MGRDYSAPARQELLGALGRASFIKGYGMAKKKTASSLSFIKRKAIPILKRHAVKRASIFGSFARGTAKTKSDVDFLIEYKGKEKSLFDLVDLKADLEETLNRK